MSLTCRNHHFEGQRTRVRHIPDFSGTRFWSRKYSRCSSAAGSHVAWSLWSYSQHLRENRQRALQYEIALWTKLMYRCSAGHIILALPFASFRSAGRMGGRSSRESCSAGFLHDDRLFSRPWGCFTGGQPS